MRFSSRALISGNLAVVLLGCGNFNSSFYKNEYLPPATELKLVSKSKTIFEDFYNIYGQSLKNCSPILGKINNKGVGANFWIKKYEAFLKKEISQQRFSISDNFEKEFLDYANQLFDNNASDIFFKLVCFVINVVYVIDNDQSLNLNKKKNKISIVYNTYLKIVDYLVAKRFNLPICDNNENIIPTVNPDYCLFKIQDLINNLQASEIYTLQSPNSDKMVFPCGHVGNILEQFVSPSIDENGYMIDMTIEKTFKILKNHENELQGCTFLNNSFETILNKDLLIEISQKYEPLLKFTEVLTTVKKRSIVWGKFFNCLKILKENKDSLIPFYDNFELKRQISGSTICIKDSQKIFDKKKISPDSDDYKCVLKDSIVNSKFQLINDALSSILNLSQKDAFDIIAKKLDNKIIPSWTVQPVVCSMEDFIYEVKNKKK